MLKTRKVVAGLALGALPFIGGLAAAPPASAMPPRESITCGMEIDGVEVSVPVGYRYGMLVCGSDGNWRWGWFITG